MSPFRQAHQFADELIQGHDIPILLVTIRDGTASSIDEVVTWLQHVGWLRGVMPVGFAGQVALAVTPPRATWTVELATATYETPVWLPIIRVSGIAANRFADSWPSRQC